MASLAASREEQWLRADQPREGEEGWNVADAWAPSLPSAGVEDVGWQELLGGGAEGWRCDVTGVAGRSQVLGGQSMSVQAGWCAGPVADTAGVPPWPARKHRHGGRQQLEVSNSTTVHNITLNSEFQEHAAEFQKQAKEAPRRAAEGQRKAAAGRRGRERDHLAG